VTGVCPICKVDGPVIESSPHYCAGCFYFVLTRYGQLKRTLTKLRPAIIAVQNQEFAAHLERRQAE